MRNRIGTIILVLFLFIGIAGMVYFNYTLFKPSEGLEEILLEPNTPNNPQSTVAPGEKTPSVNSTEPKELYSNNFASLAVLADFQVIDTGDKGKPSKWEIKNGELYQSSNIWGGTYDKPIAGKQFLGTYIVLKNKTFTNFDMRVDMRSIDNDGMGVIFRHDGNNYYRLLTVKDASNGGPFIMLDKHLLKNNLSTFIALKTKEWEYEQNKTYTLTIQANESKIKVWINETLMFDTVDASINSGSVGFYSYGDEGLAFDNLKITEVGGLTNQLVGATPSNIISQNEANQLEANTYLEKITGFIQSRNGNALMLKNEATGKIQKVQLLAGLDLRKNSATGVKAEDAELVVGANVEVSGSLYQSKLNPENIFIAERIILKSS